MNFRTVFAVHQPVTSSTKCILQFWQRFSRTLEKSGGTSFAWCMNFCANRGLTCKMYGRVLKIDFVPVFNTIPRARICMNFKTVFADSQLAVSSGLCIRSWVRLIVLQKKNLNYSKFWTEKIIVRVFPIQKKMSKISEFFMRACIRSQIFRENWSYSFTYS